MSIKPTKLEIARDLLIESIFEKDRGQINLPERFKIIWNKDYINIKKS